LIVNAWVGIECAACSAKKKSGLLKISSWVMFLEQVPQNKQKALIVERIDM